ncbi:1536_t:CDS:1, partial [Gigaspora rosea]
WSEARFIPDMMAPTIAKFIYKDILYHHRCPRVLFSSQERSFCNEIVDTLCEIMTAHHQLAAAYHLQTNGLIERFNKLVEDYKTTWDTLLPAALFAYRTLPNYITKYNSFFLTYGHNANLPIDLQLQKEEMPKKLLEQSLDVILKNYGTTTPTKTPSSK